MPDVSPCVLDGSLLGLSHPVLNLGECLFDRIEIGQVRRQEPEPCSGGLDDLADGGRLVAAEIDGVDALSRHRCAKVVPSIIT